MGIPPFSCGAFIAGGWEAVLMGSGHAPQREAHGCALAVIPGWCISTRPQMRACASGNLEILRCAIAHRSSMLRPGMTGWTKPTSIAPPPPARMRQIADAVQTDAISVRDGIAPR